MNGTAHTTLIHIWFCLLGLMLVLYVVTDGFDLGMGVLSLFTPQESQRSLMMQTIGHVWDANETWLVVLGGALFGAFPAAYALLLSHLYLPVMAMIGGLILRGAALEFRHPARRKRYWDMAFGLGSLIATAAQGVILGRVITGFAPGAVSTGFTILTALGVASGYALLGATYLIQKVNGALEQRARKRAVERADHGCRAILVSAAPVVLASGRPLELGRCPHLPCPDWLGGAVRLRIRGGAHRTQRLGPGAVSGLGPAVSWPRSAAWR